MPIHGAAQIDVAEHLELPSLAPMCFVDLENIAGGDGARVVHQYVDVGEFVGQSRRRARAREVDGLGMDCGAAGLREPLRRGAQPFLIASRDYDIAAFFEEALRHRVADSLRATCHQHAAALQTQIHGLPPVETAAPYDRLANASIIEESAAWPTAATRRH